MLSKLSPSLKTMIIALCPLFLMGAGDLMVFTGAAKKLVKPGAQLLSTIVVNTTFDAVDSNLNDDVCDISATPGNQCSLRAAVQNANKEEGPNAIFFQCPTMQVSCLYKLTIPGSESSDGLHQGDLDVFDDLYIYGEGATRTIIDGNKAHRIFDVREGSLHLNKVTLQNGKATIGGAIHSGNNVDKVSVIESILLGNHATNGNGGAIRNHGAELSIIRTTIKNNTATDGGGGIATIGNLGVDASTISNNQATGDEGSGGGIIANNFGIHNSTISGNSAYDGGGIYVVKDDAKSRIDSSTIYGNSASNAGGGIFNRGELKLTNTTVAMNSAPEGAGILTYIYKTPGYKTKTILRNTLLAAGPAGKNCGGDTVSSAGNNIESHNSCKLSGNNDQPNKDPKLYPAGLKDNGGWTKTVSLMPKSPAIDAANNSLCESTDQRGTPRPQPQGGKCDIGAYEAAPVAILLANNNSLAFNAVLDAESDKKNVILTNGGNKNLTITNIALSDTVNFKGTSDCLGQTIPAQAHCKLSMVFSPTLDQDFAEQVNITSSGGNQVVALAGTVVDPLPSGIEAEPAPEQQEEDLESDDTPSDPGIETENELPVADEAKGTESGPAQTSGCSLLRR